MPTTATTTPILLTQLPPIKAYHSSLVRCTGAATVWNIGRNVSAIGGAETWGGRAGAVWGSGGDGGAEIVAGGFISGGVAGDSIAGVVAAVRSSVGGGHGAGSGGSDTGDPAAGAVVGTGIGVACGEA